MFEFDSILERDDEGFKYSVPAEALREVEGTKY
jgi:hypothetical protein